MDHSAPLAIYSGPASCEGGELLACFEGRVRRLTRAEGEATVHCTARLQPSHPRPHPRPRRHLTLWSLSLSLSPTINLARCTARRCCTR